MRDRTFTVSHHVLGCFIPTVLVTLSIVPFLWSDIIDGRGAAFILPEVLLMSAFAYLSVRIFRSKVVPRAEHLVIVNPLRTWKIAWEDIAEFHFGYRFPGQAGVKLRNGREVALFAVATNQSGTSTGNSRAHDILNELSERLVPM